MNPWTPLDLNSNHKFNWIREVPIIEIPDQFMIRIEHQGPPGPFRISFSQEDFVNSYLEPGDLGSELISQGVRLCSADRCRSKDFQK
jgi:hypothetical protein